MGNNVANKSDDISDLEDPNKQKRSQNKNRRNSCASCRDSGTSSRTKGINHQQLLLIKSILSTSKHLDLAVRIMSRLFFRKPELRQIFEEDSRAHVFSDLLEALQGSLDRVFQGRCDTRVIRDAGLEMGLRFASYRKYGFRPEYFVELYEALTFECVHLDEGRHTISEVVEAWSVITNAFIDAAREGYYCQIQAIRKLSRDLRQLAQLSAHNSMERPQYAKQGTIPESPQHSLEEEDEEGEEDIDNSVAYRDS